MKSSILTAALGGTILLTPVLAHAQQAGPSFGSSQRPSIPAGAPATGDSRVVKAEAGVPELRPASDLKPPALDLPDEPVEPYLLTEKAGPYMVLSRSFVGTDAEKLALALVKELRDKYGLPAYILRTKDYPGRSTLNAGGGKIAQTAGGKPPGKFRTIEEAAVLVGDEKTPDGQEKLLQQLKKIQPDSLKKVSTPFWWRAGRTAFMKTTNPYVPARSLHAQATDRLIVRMNSGLRSISNCPGRYSLQVADFSGRTAFQLNPNVRPAQLLPDLNSSPLRKAADDAERMAEKLSKAPEIQRLGVPIYVYHDRTTSKVFIGAFNAPQDPAAVALRNQLVQDAYVMSDTKARGKAATDTMIVPALALTDLTDIKATLGN
jgi:hypothetical protein